MHALDLPGTPDSTPEPYAALTSLSIRRNSPRAKRLLSWFDIDDEPEPLEPEALTKEHAEAIEPRYGLFEHQRDAIERATVVLSREPNRAVLHMPTGAGKTRVAMNIVADHLRQNEPSLAIWLAYSEELCEQAVEEFRHAWEILGNRTTNVYRFWGRFENTIHELRDGLIVAGLSKTYNYITSNAARASAFADHVSMVVVDEAHQAIAETYSASLDLLASKRPGTWLLGLTATPGRTWDELDHDQRLADFFGRNKVSLRIESYDNPVEYLIDNGYLSRPTFRSLLYSGGISPTHQDLARLEAELEIPLNILNQLAQDEQRNLSIVRELERLLSIHTRVLLFGATVDHAETIAAVLRARGYNARTITSKTPWMQRDEILDQFQGGDAEPQLLCSFGVLTTGFDAPQVSAALIARPTKSLVLYSQMVGRAIRGPRMGGTSTCEIVTVIDQSLPGFGSISDAFTNWDDVWKEE